MLEPKITNAGKDEIARAIATGTAISIERIWLGSGSLLVSAETLKLARLEETIKVESTKAIAKGRIHLTAIADHPSTEYQVTEIGFVTSKDILLAVVSGNGKALAYKLKTQELLLAFDLVISEIPDGVINIEGSGERLNLDMATQLASMALQQTVTQIKVLDLIDRLTRLEARK